MKSPEQSLALMEMSHLLLLGCFLTITSPLQSGREIRNSSLDPVNSL